MKVILLSGKQGSGKSTLQVEIARQWEARSQVNIAYCLNFSDPLYLMHNEVLRVAHELGIEPELGRKDGRLLQVLGTDWARTHYGEAVWVDYMQRSLAKLEDLSDSTLSIIGDARFPNELNLESIDLRVRLECSEAVRRSRAAGWRPNTDHPSEVALDEAAANGRFDLYLNTEALSVSEAAETILKHLGESV